MPSPEELARRTIDAQLSAAGWVVHDGAQISLGSGLGVAMCKYRLATSSCEYLLFVHRKACGMIEAKPEGVTLSGAAEQASRYQRQLPAQLPAWGDPLRFGYEACAFEILLSDRTDPSHRFRYLFGFHRPESLHQWLKSGSSLRARLNVPFEVFRIRTEIGERGGKIDAGYTVARRDWHMKRFAEAISTLSDTSTLRQSILAAAFRGELIT